MRADSFNSAGNLTFTELNTGLMAIGCEQFVCFPTVFKPQFFNILSTQDSAEPFGENKISAKC